MAMCSSARAWREAECSRITKFTKDGKFHQELRHMGPGRWQLRSPHALAIDSQDRILRPT